MIEAIPAVSDVRNTMELSVVNNTDGGAEASVSFYSYVKQKNSTHASQLTATLLVDFFFLFFSSRFLLFPVVFLAECVENAVHIIYQTTISCLAKSD